MKNKTLLFVAFAGLILLNLGTLGVLWFGSGPGPGLRDGPGPGPIGPPQKGPKDFISQELKFSPDQKEAFEKLRSEHFEEVREIERKIGDTRALLLKQYALDQGDAEAEILIDKMAALRANIERVTFLHFRQVRNLCDNEQKAVFDHIIEEVMNRMTRKPPPHKPTRRQKESLP